MVFQGGMCPWRGSRVTTGARPAHAPATGRWFRARLDRAKLRASTEGLATSNKWDALLDSTWLHQPTGEMMEDFERTAKAVAADFGCMKQPPGKRPFHTLSWATKKLVNRRRQLTVMIQKAPWQEVERLQEEWRAVAKAAKEGVKSDSADAWRKLVAGGAWLLRENKPRLFWGWVKSLTGRSRVFGRLHPVWDAEGNLQTDTAGITQVFSSHYRTLAQDPDPKGFDWWQCNHPLEKRPRLPRLNRKIGWPEVNATLQALQAGKAAGSDGLPPELFKIACETEPERLPATPLGRAVLALVQAIWKDPGSGFAKVVSIPKPGDQALQQK